MYPSRTSSVADLESEISERSDQRSRTESRCDHHGKVSQSPTLCMIHSAFSKIISGRKNTRRTRDRPLLWYGPIAS